MPVGPDMQTGELLVWINFEERLRLHLAADVNWNSLEESSALIRKYVSDAQTILGGSDITEEPEKEEILETLGYPPDTALPLYFIVIEKDAVEKLVYIGKTTAANRFSGGHLVALKLHDPAYKYHEKIIYRCSVTVHINDWVQLEWMDPLSVATDLLDDIESHLIFDLKPIFNTSKKAKPCAAIPVSIHFQNHQYGFMHDYII
jgi:hypothetical protein